MSEKGHVFTFHFPPPHLSLKSGEEFSTRCSVSPSPSIRALHSGVSVLEHSGNDVGINGDAHNSAGAADVSKSLHYIPSDATNWTHLACRYNNSWLPTPLWLVWPLRISPLIQLIPFTLSQNHLGQRADTKYVNYVCLTEEEQCRRRADPLYYEWERSKIEQVNALHLLSRWWWGRGESGCYKNKKPTVAADTNKNDGVEINEYHRDVDALDGMTYLCLLCPL